MNPTTEVPSLTSASFEDLVREMIVRIGEDPEREGLVRTPDRVRRSWEFLSRGYKEDPDAMLRKALFTVTYDEMVIVKDVEMFSLCEHHMLPFFGKVHVAYIPKGKVIGLSKIPRLIEIFSRRLQIQERLTTQIAETIQKAIEPQGVGVVIEARHLCMMMRGVEKQHSRGGNFLHAGMLPQRTGNAHGIFVADPQPNERALRQTSVAGISRSLWLCGLYFARRAEGEMPALRRRSAEFVRIFLQWFWVLSRSDVRGPSSLIHQVP